MTQVAQMTKLDRDAHRYAPAGDYEATFADIARLSEKRRKAWLLAGLGVVTWTKQEYDTVARELLDLWDRYRRELAAARYPDRGRRPRMEDGWSKRGDLRI